MCPEKIRFKTFEDSLRFERKGYCLLDVEYDFSHDNFIGELWSEKEIDDSYKEDVEKILKESAERDKQPFGIYKNMADCIAKNQHKNNPFFYCSVLRDSG